MGLDLIVHISCIGGEFTAVVGVHRESVHELVDEHVEEGDVGFLVPTVLPVGM